MKPYSRLPIQECGEPLVPIPADRLSLTQPHPYEQLGAPYADRSPFFLRQGVLTQLLAAQAALQTQQPGWRIQVFDAYRPIAVQQFMVDYTFLTTVQAQGQTPESLTPEARQVILEQVYQFWAIPSPDPTTPPPHSTGAAVDVTLVDGDDRPVPMGSEIDELSPRSYPDYFANSSESLASLYHAHRQLLWQVMSTAGFERHPNEWWHFSSGDQMWAWLVSQRQVDRPVVARYGGV